MAYILLACDDSECLKNSKTQRRIFLLDDELKQLEIASGNLNMNNKEYTQNLRGFLKERGCVCPICGTSDKLYPASPAEYDDKKYKSLTDNEIKEMIDNNKCPYCGEKTIESKRIVGQSSDPCETNEYEEFVCTNPNCKHKEPIRIGVKRIEDIKKPS